MNLLTLSLENFQGIKSETFEFGGNSASIYGDNATGKTTAFNAFTYLLFDKASTEAPNFTPKTKDENGNDVHHLDHAVTAAFRLNDGQTISMKKVYHEVYKKKRGSATEKCTGHTADYYLDGVPVSQKEYNETLVNLCGDIENMKLLTMPHYFPESISWNNRREILLDLCGDVTDEDVIANTEELKALPEFLMKPGTKGDQYYTVGEYKKIAGVKRSQINKELESIPDRIDEAQRAMPDITGLDRETIDKNIAELTNRKSELESEKTQVLNGDTVMVMARNQIAELNAELAELRSAHAIKASSLNEGTYSAINDIKSKQIESKNRIQDAQNSLEQAERTIKRLKQRRESLIGEYKEIQSESWDESNETCPTCHQLLPNDQVQQLRETFNLKKSQRLEKINQQGNQEASQTMIDEQVEKVGQFNYQIATEEQLIKDYTQQLEILQNQLQTPTPFESTQEYADIMTKINTLRSEENNSSQRTETLTDGLNEKIRTLTNEIRQQEELKMHIALAANQEDRIKELEIQEQDLAAQFERLEQGIYLCELFVKEKVALLTDRINGKFKSVRFRLFVEQQNGGIKEDCEVMIPTDGGRMVPFAYANNAARINAGLEVIDALSKHWDLKMPVFVDNAESVTKLLQLETQVIRLVVSEQDKKLRLEVEN